MQTTLTPFAFDDYLFRVHLDENDNPWFVAKDICRVLELGNVTEATRSLEEDEKGLFRITEQTPQGGNPNVLIISESGLYTLIFRSRKPEARRFRKWVTSEVLPAIRKTGTYTAPSAPPVPPAVQPERGVPPLLEEARNLRPAMRRRLWQDALQTARLDNAGSEKAAFWFAHLCRMMVQKPTTVFEEVQSFFEECCMRAPDRNEKATVVYEAFRAWRRGSASPMPSMRIFGEHMHLLARAKRSNGIVYCDIALRKNA